MKTCRHSALRSGRGQRLAVAVLAITALVTANAEAATIYWTGQSLPWSATTAWSLDPAATTPNPTAIPGILDDVVDKMQRYPEVELIVVTGHTDRIGTEAYNRKLSDRRAASVRNYLVNKGVDASRVQSVGRGESEPVVGCGNVKGKERGSNKALVECLQPNRRVVIEIAVQRETGAN